MTARLACLFVLFAAACDPAWGVSVELRDPGDIPVTGVTVALACDNHSPFRATGFSTRTDEKGVAHIGGIGSQIPVGCDLFIAKPGLAPVRIRYKEMCPNIERGCERVFQFALVVEACPALEWNHAPSEPACRGYSHRLRRRGDQPRMRAAGL